MSLRPTLALSLRRNPFLASMLSFEHLPRRLMSSSSESDPGHSFYHHTSGRWVYNNDQQLAARHTLFNLEQLKKLACSILQASACNHVQKIAEGSCNKVLRMHLDTGRTVIARIPSTVLLGNGSLATASEVATMEFMRAVHSLHVPTVYAWAKDASDPVGSPYILMEDVPHPSLDKEWLSVRGERVASALLSTADYYRRMASVSFGQIGSIYFKDDLPADMQKQPLLSTSTKHSHDEVLDRFRVGPIAHFGWWRTMHDDADLDRGPCKWKSFGDMVIAAVRLEQRAIDRYKSHPELLRTTHTRSVEELDVLNSLLEKVETLAPSLSAALENHPVVGNSLSLPVAIHGDLHASNIMIPPDTGDNTISRFRQMTYIDWQGTSVLPFVLHGSVPPLFKYSLGVFDVPLDSVQPLPAPTKEDLEGLTEEEQDKLMWHHRLACREQAFKKRMDDICPAFTAAQLHPLYPYIVHLTSTVLRGVAEGPVVLRNCLIRIWTRWIDEECGGSCPIWFTREELELHEVEWERRVRYESAKEGVARTLGLGTDGWVAREEGQLDFEEVVARMGEIRDEWDEEQCGGPWPFEDGRPSDALT